MMGTPLKTPQLRACAQCINWEPVSGDVGECRARAPRFFPVPVVGLDGKKGMSIQTTFPTTAPECWCGEFTGAA